MAEIYANADGEAADAADLARTYETYAAAKAALDAHDDERKPLADEVARLGATLREFGDLSRPLSVPGGQVVWTSGPGGRASVTKRVAQEDPEVMEWLGSIGACEIERAPRVGKMTLAMVRPREAIIVARQGREFYDRLVAAPGAGPITFEFVPNGGTR